MTDKDAAYATRLAIEALTLHLNYDRAAAALHITRTIFEDPDPAGRAADLTAGLVNLCLFVLADLSDERGYPDRGKGMAAILQASALSLGRVADDEEE